MSYTNKKIKIYLAGKMSGFSFNQMNDWRQNLKTDLIKMGELFNYKMIIINPVDYYNFEEKKYQSEREVRDYDLKHATTSDIIIVNLEGLKTSDGTKYEIHDCNYHHNIPVIAFGKRELYNELHPWIKEDITRVEDNGQDVVSYIRDFYMI